MSMKPKVALVKDGFLPAGSENKRGRLSAAAIERCKELVGSGWAIEGYSVDKPTTNTTAPVAKKIAAADPNRIADVPDEARSESLWSAYANHNGSIVPVGMRTVCNGCHSSLTYCYCKTPRVWLDHMTEVMVNFKPAK